MSRTRASARTSTRFSSPNRSSALPDTLRQHYAHRLSPLHLDQQGRPPARDAVPRHRSREPEVSVARGSRRCGRQAAGRFLLDGAGRHRPSQQLALALATRSKLLRDYLGEELVRQEREHKEGRLYGLYEVFRDQVFHELTPRNSPMPSRRCWLRPVPRAAQFRFGTGHAAQCARIRARVVPAYP